MKIKSLIPVLLLGLLIVGCGPSKKSGEGPDEFNDAEKSLKNQLEEVVYNIPSPTEIPYMLQSTGAEFNSGLINDKKSAPQYAGKTDKTALNLGVYAADIAYLASYEKTQESIDYMNTCKSLADNLGLMGSFDVELMKKFEANVSNKDSLASLLNQTMKKADKYLRDDTRNKLAALVVAGSFVEGLYISTGVVKTYPKDLLPADQRNLILTPVMRVILKQKESVGQLIKMLKDVDQTEPVASIVNDLTALQNSYTSLNIEDKIKNNRSDLVLTDKNLTDITAITERLRKSIVQ